MEFLNMDSQTIVWLSVICALVCGGLIVISLFFQVLGTVFGMIGGVVELFVGVLAGGPASWCGCIVLVFICGGLTALTFFFFNVAQSCGTVDQVNLCRLLGY